MVYTGREFQPMKTPLHVSTTGKGKTTEKYLSLEERPVLKERRILKDFVVDRKSGPMHLGRPVYLGNEEMGVQPEKPFFPWSDCVTT